MMKLEFLMRRIIWIVALTLSLTACSNIHTGESVGSSSAGSDEKENSGSIDDSNMYNETIVNVTTPDGWSIDIPEVHLLIAVDISGSMKQLDEVIDELLGFATQLAQNESIQTDYLTFNTKVNENMNYEDIVSVCYQGETSVYCGMNSINEWIEKEMQSSKNIRMGVIVLSDLFTSRDKDGKYYTVEQAKEEQNILNNWAYGWNDLIKKGVLSVCFISWESLTEGEQKVNVLESSIESGNIKKGFQVELSDLEDYMIDISDYMSQHDGAHQQLKQDMVSNYVCGIMKVLTGLDGLEWKKVGNTNKWQHSADIEIQESYRVFIQVNMQEDNKQQGSEKEFCQVDFQEKVSEVGGMNKNEFDLLLDDVSIKLYMAESTQKKRMKVTTVPLDCSSEIWILYIPDIIITPNLDKYLEANAGDKIQLTINSNDCGPADIRWSRFSKNKTIIIEVKDRENKEKIICSCSFSLGEDNIVFSIPAAGKMDIEISYLDWKDEKVVIKDLPLEIKNKYK